MTKHSAKRIPVNLEVGESPLIWLDRQIKGLEQDLNYPQSSDAVRKSPRKSLRPKGRGLSVGPR